jgi:hypothetical protein
METAKEMEVPASVDSLEQNQNSVEPRIASRLARRAGMDVRNPRSAHRNQPCNSVALGTL